MPSTISTDLMVVNINRVHEMEGFLALMNERKDHRTIERFRKKFFQIDSNTFNYKPMEILLR